MMRWIVPFAFAIGLLLPLISLTNESGAHSGGTNSYGCHNETATGGYHCH